MTLFLLALNSRKTGGMECARFPTLPAGLGTNTQQQVSENQEGKLIFVENWNETDQFSFIIQAKRKCKKIKIKK